ncbi:hypothetical protein BH23CHL7_BH23CHL7_08860 [soil metagenome]
MQCRSADGGPAVYSAAGSTLHGYGSAREIVGLTIRHARPAGELPPPAILPDACNGCAVCETACVYGAIHVIDGHAAIDGELCERCGLCVARCRLGAIDWPIKPALSGP